MNKLLLLLVAGPVISFCQYPSLNQYKLSGISSTVFEYQGCFLNSDCHEKQEKRITEVPPWIINGGVRTYFFVDGRQSVLWSSPKSLTTNSTIDLKNYGNGPDVATRPYIMERYYSSRVKKFDWRRNYHAIYSAQVLWPRDGGRVVVGFCHSENKNEVSGNCSDGNWVTNTIQANVPVDCNDRQTWSGGKPYQDGWKAYNALLTAVWTPYNEQTAWAHGEFAHDMGPIAWPCTGYVTTSGIKATSGLRHPSSIVRGDSVYVFFVDGGPYGDNIPEEEGRKGGVKVLRVHKDQARDAHNYRVYYKDPQGRAHWTPSLPAGFTKETMLQYVTVKGPKSTTLINDTGAYYQVIRFSVARLKDAEGYLGVEQYMDFIDRTADQKPKWKVALRYSSDLVNWSDRKLIVYSADSWEASQMNYPVLLNKEGTSNTEVDANEFYVVGSEHKPVDHINKIRVFDPHYQPPAPLQRQPAEMAMPSSAAGQAFPLDVLVYPNPFEGVLRIRLKAPRQSRVQISLIDGNGKKIRSMEETGSGNAADLSFDLSVYPAGLYFLQFMVNDTYVSKKLVKL